jgi:SAM-dependent methyltransferase
MADIAYPSLATNYETSAGVRDRFLTYTDFAEPDKSPVDPDIMEIEIADMLRLQNILSIVELGSSDGTFLDLLQNYSRRDASENTQQFVGFEPNISQWQPDKVNSMDSKLREHLQNIGIDLEPIRQKRRPIIVDKSAEAIVDLEENSVDCLLAFYMLYHLDQMQQSQVLENSGRILGPNGIFIATTSSQNNKPGHRLLERYGAESLGIQAPEFMNSSFTSERAALILPEHFSEVWRADITGTLQKDGYNDVGRQEVMERYIRSQLSLADQYIPPQKRDDPRFMHMIRKLVETEFDNPDFVDRMHRTIFIASNGRLIESPFIDMTKSDLEFRRIS